jgi:hypothetical protein
MYLLGNKGAHIYNGNMSTAEKLFQCHKCYKQYKSPVTLKNHKCSYCENCKKLYSTFQKRKLHKRCSQQAPSNIQITSSDHSTFRFKPTTITWQRKQSSDMGINRIVPCQRPRHDKLIGKPSNVTPINGDGNCFFRCISYLITGTESNHFLLRTLLVQHMESHQLEMSTILPNQTLSQYLISSKMVLNRTWASEIEIYAMAHFLKTDIYVYTLIGETNLFQWLCHSACFIDPSVTKHNESVYLFHRNGNHYEIVTDVVSENTTSNAVEKFRFTSART